MWNKVDKTLAPSYGEDLSVWSDEDIRAAQWEANTRSDKINFHWSQRNNVRDYDGMLIPDITNLRTGSHEFQVWQAEWHNLQDEVNRRAKQRENTLRITEQKLRQMVRNVLKGKDLEFVKAWRGSRKSQDIGWAYIKTNRGVFMALESKPDVWGPVPSNHKKVSSSRQPVKKKASKEQTAALVNFWKENTPRNSAAEALAKSDKEKADKAAARKKQDTPANREALRKRQQRWKEESKAAGYGGKKKKKKGSGFGEYAGNGDKDNPGTAF